MTSEKLKIQSTYPGTTSLARSVSSRACTRESDAVRKRDRRRERRALCKSDFLSLNFVTAFLPSSPLSLFPSNILSTRVCRLSSFASYAFLIPLRISLDAPRGGRKSTKEVGVHPAYGCWTRREKMRRGRRGEERGEKERSPFTPLVVVVS